MQMKHDLRLFVVKNVGVFLLFSLKKLKENALKLQNSEEIYMYIYKCSKQKCF